MHFQTLAHDDLMFDQIEKEEKDQCRLCLQHDRHSKNVARRLVRTYSVVNSQQAIAIYRYLSLLVSIIFLRLYC